jgi:cell wall/surface repeat protein
MSKKGLKTMLVCIVLLIGLVTLFACNKSDVADKDGQTKVIVKIQDEDGSIYKENVVFSDLFTLSLQKEGYTGRLYRDADFLKPLTKDSKVKNGDTVYVNWTINSYTVTFMDGKTLLKTEKVQHGSAAPEPKVPEKDGKTFKGWDKPFDNVTSDLTINAVYDVDTFTVTFKDGDTVLSIQTVEYEAAATAPDTARLSPPEGMHFAKWDKDFSKVTEDIEVSAVYERNVYTVTFKNGETTITTRRVEHGSAATPPNVYDTATKKFVGWDKPFDNVTSDLIVNATWETKKFTLTFIDHNDQEIHKKVLEWGAPVEEEYNAAEDKISIAAPFGYVGWYDNSDTKKTIIEDFSELKMPTHDLTLVLKVELTDSAIGDFKVENPKNFTYSENNSAKFIISGKTYDGVTYEYFWTILKDNEVYRMETTTDEQSLTLQNLDAGKYFANVKIVASVEGCGSVEKDITADKTLIVSRADISGITVTGVTMTYGDKTAKIGISGHREGDVITYKKDEAGEEFKENVDLWALNAGEYGYYVRIDRGDNYNPYTSDKITVKINMATVTATVTPDDDKLTYGDNLPSLTAKIGEETYTIESGKYELHLGMTSITGNVANNVGTYNIENVDISDLYKNYPDKNYEIKVETEGTITINEADLTVTVSLDKTELTYGEVSPIISYTFSELKLSDKEDDFTITKTKFAEKLDVGTYTDTAPVKVSGEKTEFYNITVNEVSFKVNKRDATIKINEIKNIVYGDKVPVLKATVEGVLVGDSLSYTLNPNYEVGNKPGDYTASVVFDENAAENKNYAIAAPDTTFNVDTKSLTIKLDSNVSVGNVAKTYTVEVGSQDLVIGELATGDVIEGSVSITSSEGGTFVDDKAFQKNIVIKNAAGEVVTAYYEIKYNLKVVFVKYDFEINADDKTVTYNGAPQNVDLVTWDASKTYKVMYGTAANECNAESLRELNCINAGTYTIYFKVVDTANGAEEKGSVKFTISPAEVTVKVNDVTITYGDTPKFEYTVTGLVEGETLSGEAVYTAKTLSGEEINIGAGTDAGEYVISVSDSELTASNNYNVSFVPGTLTINKKTAEVAWSIAESYVYNDGQTLPTATYEGKTANLIFTKDGKACEFKNAGTYTVTIADDNNYDLTGSETTKTIVINKAKYTAAPELSLTGTYDPNKTLGNYTLSEGFTWVNPDEVPVCTKTVYEAKYNKDPANYEDFETKVTLDLQKATVTLAQNLFEFNYDGASHEISTTVRYNNIEVTEPYTLTFEKNMFSAAGTHKTTATLTADNYDLPKNTYVYVKVRGVKVGNNYYTIEEALARAAETNETNEKTIFVLNDTAFATQEIAGVLYNDVKFKTVKTGVTLLLPFNENDTVGHIGAGDDTSDNYKATAALTGTAKLYRTLVIPEGIEVIVNGKLVVGAQTGKIDAGQRQNAVSGNYCEITLGGTITLNNATLEVYGYIKGNGEIIANNTTVIENLYLSGWMGGTQSAVRYIGTQDISASKLLKENTMTIKNPKMFPFSQYELRAIQSRVIINKGSKLQGYTKIATSKLEKDIIITITIPAQVNEATLTFISSDESNAANGLFRLVGNNSKIIKSMNGDRVKFDLFGGIKDGYTAVSVKVVKATVEMSSKEVFFPIDGRTDITLKNGATFTQSYMFKALPGATITVESGGIYNLNGTLVMYDKSFTDISTYPYPGAARGDAKLIVNGTMNVNGALGGNVTSDNAGAVSVGANATISGVHSAEGEGTMDIGLPTKFTFNDTCGVTKSLVFVNANNSTVAAKTDRTYNYNNGTWQ